MAVFKNILVPISSEYYSNEVLERGAVLAEKFESIITLIYIIEEKTLHQAEKLSDSYRTHSERIETTKAIIREQIRAADNIVFEDAKFFLKNRDIEVAEKVVKGEFSSVIQYELSKANYDLILMGYKKECLLHYRLFKEVHIPIWIESKSGDHSILAVCSNLAPNQRVPDISLHLSQFFDWDLHMLYVVDIQDSVEVDKNGQRSSRKPVKDLIAKGEKFVEEMRKKGIQVDLVRGSLEKETIKAADRIGANLVIVGREQKKNSMLGLPVKSVRQKMAEKCRYSILFVN